MVISIKRKGRVAYLPLEYPKELLDKLTSYTIPGVWYMPVYHKMKMVRREVNGTWRLVQERVWDGKVHLLQDDTIPFGLVPVLNAELEKDGYQIVVKEDANEYEGEVLPSDGTSRPYQEEAVEAMLAARNLGGLVICATASGKTRMTGNFFKRLKSRHLFIVDELTLLHQAKEELEKVTEEEIGLVGESNFMPRRVTVATIQTLFMHYKENKSAFSSWFRLVRFVVVDEIHSQLNRRNFGVLTKLNPQAVYGLTATLELKKKDVRLKSHALCGPILYEYPLQQGIEEEYLSPLHVVLVKFPNAEIDCKYLMAYRLSIVENEDRNRLGANLAKAALEAGHKVIVLVDRVRHLNWMRVLLEEYNPEIIWGGRDSKDRIEVKKSFEKGDCRLIITNKVFEKGIDLPSISVGIDMAAMKSANKAIQKLGRLARRKAGKDYALYFDMSDYNPLGKSGVFERAAKARVRAYKAAGLKSLVIKVDKSSQAEAAFKAILAKVDGGLKQTLKLYQEEDASVESGAVEVVQEVFGHTTS